MTTRSGPGDRTGGSFPRGAALLDAGTAWVLIDEAGPRSLGGVLAWARRAGADQVELVLSGTDESVAADLARRASQCTRPVTVTTDDATIVAGAPFPVVLDGPQDVDSLVETIRVSGCEVILEHGIIRGEWLGLEVCRIEGGALDVGVGKSDREIARLTHASMSASEAIAAVLAQIEGHRRAGAPFHPMRQLCRERWVRHQLLAEPALVGVSELAPIETTVARQNLREDHPALAIGHKVDGAPVLVVCTVGADLDVVPLAEDTRRARHPEATMVIVHPADLPLPGSVVSVGEWYGIEPTVIAVPPPWGAPESLPPAAL